MADLMPELRASKIVVPDSQGRERVVIEINEKQEPQIRLYHSDGSEGASLNLTDAPGFVQLRIGNLDRGAAVNLTADVSGEGCIEVTSTPCEDAATCFMRVENRDKGPEGGIVIDDGLASTAVWVREGRVECRGGRIG